MRHHKWKYVFSLILIGWWPISLWASPLVAPKHIAFLNDQTINLNLSDRDINRLSVSGDKIHSAYCPNHTCKVENDPTDPTGSMLLSLYTSDPFTLFLSTYAHRHFAIEIYPKAEPGRTIIFDPKDGGSGFLPSWAKSDYEAFLVNLTRAMMNKTSLEGFGYTSVISKTRRLPTCMRATIEETGRYNGDKVYGSIQRICNLSPSPLTLSASAFYTLGVRSVALGSQTLPSKTCDYVYEIISRED